MKRVSERFVPPPVGVLNLVLMLKRHGRILCKGRAYCCVSWKKASKQVHVESPHMPEKTDTFSEP